MESKYNNLRYQDLQKSMDCCTNCDYYRFYPHFDKNDIPRGFGYCTLNKIYPFLETQVCDKYETNKALINIKQVINNES